MNFVIQALIYLALAVAGTIIQSITGQDQAQKKPAQGVRGTLQWGGDLAPEFVVGRDGKAGQLRYAGAWGNAGETPNAYYSKVQEVSCLPIRGYAGWFMDGQRVTLAAEKTGDLGYAVLEHRVGGKDYAWINPYLGDQTAEDPLMLAQFGAHPERPYAGMIGRGCGYFVATTLFNRERFPSLPEFMAEPEGIALDDPRGDGQHDNPIVAIYTLLKGLTYDGEWVYGPQGITDANFRPANLEAEADKCDLVIDGRKQFRIGMSIALDEQPHTVIGELLKGSAGRWADLGGVYRFLIGAPAAPVVAITDEDIVITEQQTLEPFPGLEGLYNAMLATYPEPDEGWQYKEAPPRYSSALEAADDNRRLPFSTQYRAVPWAVQVQHLMRLALEEARRFRRHTQTMPPEFWEYEPLDVVAWTSARNGYVAKEFLITVQEDLPNANQFVGLQEIDPTDYDWSSDYELPWDVAPLVIARPAPQMMTGWNVAPYIFPDAAGTSRRIGIEVFYAASLVDVRDVRVQVYEDFGDGNLVFDGQVPYDPTDDEPSRAVTWAGIIPATDYLVQGKYIPFSGRETLWSDPLPVTTPPMRIGPSDLTEELNEQRAEAMRTIEQMQADRSRAIAQMADALAGRVVDLQTYRQEVAASFQDTKAAYTLEITAVAGTVGALVDRTELLEAVVADPVTGLVATATALDTLRITVTADLEATAEDIEALEVKAGDVSAGYLLAARVTAAPSGWDGAIQFGLRGEEGGEPSWVGLMIVRKNDGTGRIYLDADETIFRGKSRSVSGNSFIDWDTGALRLGG